MGFWEKSTRPFRWFGKGHYTAVKSGLAISEQRAAAQLTRSSVARIKQHVEDLRANRDPDAEGAPDMQDFGEVLDHWGITRAQLPMVIKAIRVEICIYALLWIAAMFGLLRGAQTLSWFTLTSSAMLFIMASSVVVCRYWRLQVLKCERFFPFKNWILGRVD